MTEKEDIQIMLLPLIEAIEQSESAKTLLQLMQKKEIGKVDLLVKLKKVNELLAFALIRDRDNQTILDYYKRYDDESYKILNQYIAHQLNTRKWVVDEDYKLSDLIIMNFLFENWRKISLEEFVDLISYLQNMDCLTQLKSPNSQTLPEMLSDSYYRVNSKGIPVNYSKQCREAVNEFSQNDNIFDFPESVTSNERFILAELFLDYRGEDESWLGTKLNELNKVLIELGKQGKRNKPECFFIVRNSKGQNLLEFYQDNNEIFYNIVINFLQSKKKTSSGRISPRKFFNRACSSTAHVMSRVMGRKSSTSEQITKDSNADTGKGKESSNGSVSLINSFGLISQSCSSSELSQRTTSEQPPRAFAVTM